MIPTTKEEKAVFLICFTKKEKRKKFLSEDPSEVRALLRLLYEGTAEVTFHRHFVWRILEVLFRRRDHMVHIIQMMSRALRT